MTTQEIVDRVNKLVINYNNSWEDIKYDVDNAMLKINAFIGTCYPMPSVYFESHTRYDISTSKGELPIISDKYFITIVIPFVASEILARDEEFTTIYNKYVQDYSDGLFEMFQNEFNKIPMEFRQSNDTGVFFARDTKQHKYMVEKEKLLPSVEFKITYHINNEDILDSVIVPLDNIKYKYGDDTKYTVLALVSSENRNVYLSVDNMSVYEFKGWSTEKGALYDTSETYLQPDDIKYGIDRNLDLYAVWQKIDLFTITSAGVLTPNSTDQTAKTRLSYIKDLIIPNYYKGIRVFSIDSNFCSYLINCNSITLPKGLTEIKTSAFSAFKGCCINFTKSNIDVTIQANAFVFTNSNIKLDTLYIPNNFKPTTSTTLCFGSPTGASKLKLYFETLYVNSRFNTGNYNNSCIIEWGWNNV